MTNKFRQPPFPDDVKLTEPGPPAGPIRRFVRYICRRLLGWWINPLQHSVEDKLHQGAVARRDLYAELDDRLKKLEELNTNSRLTALECRGESAPSSEPKEKSKALNPPSALAQGFRFRGDVKELEERAIWYLEQLPKEGLIYDLGCGQGVFLALCQEQGRQIRGFDSDKNSVEYCQQKGLPVERCDVLEALRHCESSSLRAIVASHLLEHLSLHEIVELLSLAQDKLAPKGKLLVELPHPGSLAGLSSYSKDPTHQTPIHPETCAFLLERAGFDSIETHFLSPVTKDGRLVEIKGAAKREEADQWARVAHNFALLDEVVFGYQAYCCLAEPAKKEPKSD